MLKYLFRDLPALIMHQLTIWIIFHLNFVDL
jgi:hypothetical protein